MKFTLVTFVALVGAASAVSVDFSLINKRQCIAEGGLCFTSIADTTEPCCGGLYCETEGAPNTNICKPEPSPVVPVGSANDVKRDEVVERSDEPARPQARAFPGTPADEPRRV